MQTSVPPNGNDGLRTTHRTRTTEHLPDIQHALHSSFSDLQCVVDAYALTLPAVKSRNAARVSA